jgi:hypothetical protein
MWYQHDQLHRDGDQPAIERWNGGKVWYHHGLKHRIGGPAVVYTYVAPDLEWWFDGHQITREHSEWIMTRSLERAKRTIRDCLTARIYSPNSRSGRRILASHL